MWWPELNIKPDFGILVCVNYFPRDLPCKMTSIKSNAMCQSQKRKKERKNTLNFAYFIKEKRRQNCLSTVSGLLQTGLTGFVLCPIAFHSSYLLSHPETQEEKNNLDGGGYQSRSWICDSILGVFGIKLEKPFSAMWLVYPYTNLKLKNHFELNSP